MNVKILSYSWCVMFSAICIGLLYYGVLDVFNSKMRNDCKMTYMYPQYTKVQLSKNATALGPQLAKYSLYTYTERSVGDVTTKGKLRIQPVLFIPGNAGSYKQVRSIASEAARQTRDLGGENRQPLTKFAFYAIDFDEEFSAFNGRSLLAQTRFTDICVKEILAKYDAGAQLILLGHSMGGVIARGVTHMYNYDSQTIRGIVTLNTPHNYPVFAHSMRLNNYYRMLNTRNETAEGTLNGIPVVSVGGGFRDSLVNTKLTDIGSTGNRYSAISSSIPGVWASADHQMMIVLDKTLRIISESKQNRIIKDVNGLLTSKLHTMMIDNVIPKSKRLSKELGITESSKVTSVTELPLTTALNNNNEWIKFDAKEYFEAKNKGRGTVIVLAEKAKYVKAYICTDDESKCLDISQSFEIIVNKYKSERDPAPESMLWIDYGTETGLGSHTGMSKLYLHASSRVPSLQLRAFLGTEFRLPSPRNVKDISDPQEYNAPSDGVHITGPYWADKRPLNVRVYSGHAIKTAMYLIIGIFTPATGGHAQEISVQAVSNGNTVRVAAHYAPQAVDIFVLQLTQAPADFVVGVSLDVLGMVGMALRDSYQFAIAFAVASLLIARIGAVAGGAESRSTFYTVVIQAPALMIALGTASLLFGDHFRALDAFRFLGLGEILLATVLSVVVLAAVEVATWAFVLVGKVLSMVLPEIPLRVVGGVLAGILLAVPSFYGIVLIAVLLAFRIEKDARMKREVPRFARHTLRMLVMAAALAMIEAITEPNIAESLFKGMFLDGYELVVVAGLCACCIPKTAGEWLKAPKSVTSLVTVALGLAILVFGTNEYCTACTIAIWANILI